MKNSQIIVIGAGRLGSQIAKNLSSNGENVLVIDKDADSFNKLDDFSGFTQVADATDLSVLTNNAITGSKAVIVTTDDDNINLFLGDICFKIFDIPQIFIRLSDNDKKKLVENTPIHPICPFLLSMHYFETKFIKES